MEGLVGFIKNAHPGTVVYNIDGYDNQDSMENMWTQVDSFKKKMMPIFKNSSDGVHMICFSQGEFISYSQHKSNPHLPLDLSHTCTKFPDSEAGARPGL